MTAVPWLAGAVAALSVAGPRGYPARVTALVDAARVAVVPPSPRVHWRRPSARALAGACSLVVVGLASWQGGLPLGISAVAVAGLVHVAMRDRAIQRAQRRNHTDLVVAVRLLVGELAAGAQPSDALAAAAECGGDRAETFLAASRAAATGEDAAAVLLACEATHSLGVAWRLGQQTGCALAGVLDRVAADLVAMVEQRRAVAVALSGPQSSAAVLTGLPVVGVAMGIAMGAQPLTFLFQTAAGRWVCCVGVLLDIAGLLWVRRILRSAQRA